MIALTDITTDVQLFWQATVPSAVPTQFPGVPLDANGLRAWMEFWLTQGAEPPHRVRRVGEMEVLIDVHCFSRQSNKRTVIQMADQVRSTLAQRTIPIHTPESPETAPGLLRLFEATVRDLTRESRPDPRDPLQHVVVSLTGRAEAVLAPQI